MKTENSNTDKSKKQGHSHVKHMWMMAACCGLPIAGFLAIGILGISMPSLETLLLVICPIGMVAMMYMMNRDSQGKQSSCCQSEKSEGEAVISVTEDSPQKANRVSTKHQRPGSLEA